MGGRFRPRTCPKCKEEKHRVILCSSCYGKERDELDSLRAKYKSDLRKQKDMKAEELFEKACEAWGVEIRSDTQFGLGTSKRYLCFEGKPLDVAWNPESVQDLSAMHGEEAVKGLVHALLDRTIRALLGLPLDKKPATSNEKADQTVDEAIDHNSGLLTEDAGA